MYKIIACLVFLCFPSALLAGHIVDIFGEKNSRSNSLLHTYKKDVIAIESELIRLNMDLTPNEEKKLEHIKLKKKLLTEKMKKDGNFLYVSFSTVSYLDKKNLYTTIEVIEKEDPERLLMINTDVGTGKYPVASDIIQKMIEYDELGFKLGSEGQLPIYGSPCPINHCIYGFNHPQLKPYLKIFNRGAIKEKTRILNTLQKDPNPERRAAAAFLIGHFQDPQIILTTLWTFINDRSPLVRNNVLRVISETVQNPKIKHINIDPFLSLLNSPYGTDRNKILSLLVHAPIDDKDKARIISKEHKHLLALLRLKQPNNHDWTYLLLKKISGKNYGEYDIAAWENWFLKITRD